MMDTDSRIFSRQVPLKHPASVGIFRSGQRVLNSDQCRNLLFLKADLRHSLKVSDYHRTTIRASTAMATS